MECRISSFLHLNLMISQKYIQLYRNIQLGKTWSKCMFELPNIVFNPTFTCFGCRRQSLTEKMEIIAKFLPLSQWLQACSRRRKIVTRLLCVHFIENWVGGGNKWINNIVQINFWGKISPFESLQDAEKASIRPIKHCYWCKLPPWYVWGSF